MPSFTPSSNAILTARLHAANQALAKERAKKSKTNGLDAMDKFLIGATKLGLFALFGLFVAAKAKQNFTYQAPTPSNPPRPTPSYSQ